jgi:hypothetical protein
MTTLHLSSIISFNASAAIYYQVFNNSSNPYLGCIDANLVAPPHTSRFYPKMSAKLKKLLIILGLTT